MSRTSKSLGFGLVLCALGACGDTSGVPTGFGVNITVSATNLSMPVRTQLRRVVLRTTGVEENSKELLIGDFDGKGEARVRFIPRVRTGEVGISADAFDAQGAKIAEGRIDEKVTLQANAVNVTVALVDAKALAALGAGCADSTECADGAPCVDGKCCSVTACGTCEACTGAGGTCVTVIDTEDPDTCANGKVCNSTGECKDDQGQMCMAATVDACVTGLCVDGVCCDNACDGICQSCNTAGAPGSCSPLVLVEEPNCLIGTQGATMCDPVGACQPPHLIADLNKALFAATTNTLPSSPAEFTVGPGGKIYFAATDGMGGRELWATDGTAAGTARVLDIQPANLSSNPRRLVSAGGQLYFKADHPSGKSLIFRSDGTAAGTAPVSIAFTATGDEIAAFKDEVYFAAADGTAGAELWKANAGGTVMVKDIIPDIVGSQPQRFTAASDQLFFIAADQTGFVGVNAVPANFEIWRTDGTAAGTRVTTDLIPGNNAGPGVISQAALGNELLFSANVSGTVATELYKTNGTAAGTVLLKDINPSGGSDPTQLTTVGSQVFFSATIPTSGTGTGRELYKTDGTAAGTFLVRDIFPGVDGASLPNNSFPGNLTAVGNKLYFTALTELNGEELWTSDGTTGGTVMVSQIAPGTTNSNPRNLTAFGNRLFFSAVESLPGIRDLWFTDGTPSGTGKACRTSSCVVFGNMSVAGGRLWFAGATNTSTIGDEPFVFP